MSVTKPCEICSQPFQTYLCHIKAGRGRFCSYKCYWQAKKKRITLQCPTCGQPFERLLSQASNEKQRFCSNACHAKSKPAPTIILSCLNCFTPFEVKVQIVKNRKRFFCSKQCAQKSRPKKSLEERFWRHVKKTPTCWLWIGRKTNQGYGGLAWFTNPVKHILAHRASWLIHHGPIPDGLDVLHHCDTPLCVRPDHLHLGVQKDNVADMVSRNRQAKGEQAGRAKLTEAAVLEIRELAHKTALTQKTIAKMFSVSKGTVAFIIQRKTWKHI